jgi:energy-coupling factor transporter ATP-binding protein EcfA2
MNFIPFRVPKFEDFGLPEVGGTLAREERGVILVTGTTGSGKSTTLASTIDLIYYDQCRSTSLPSRTPLRSSTTTTGASSTSARSARTRPPTRGP